MNIDNKKCMGHSLTDLNGEEERWVDRIGSPFKDFCPIRFLLYSSVFYASDYVSTNKKGY